MAGQPSQLARWRRVRARLDAGQPIDQADAQWLAQGVAAVIEDGQPARVAFGLSRQGGAGGLHRVALIERRDAMLRAMHCAYFGDLKPRAAARAIAALADRLGRSGRPPRDVRERAITDVLALGQLPAERRMADILGISNPHLDFPVAVVSAGP